MQIDVDEPVAADDNNLENLLFRINPIPNLRPENEAVRLQLQIEILEQMLECARERARKAEAKAAKLAARLAPRERRHRRIIPSKPKF